MWPGAPMHVGERHPNAYGHAANANTAADASLVRPSPGRVQVHEAGVLFAWGSRGASDVWV